MSNEPTTGAEDFDYQYVTIAGETGVRIVNRESTVQFERQMERIGVWPEDKPSQRAWALSVMCQLTKSTWQDTKLSTVLTEADKIVEWVQDGVMPE